MFGIDPFLLVCFALIAVLLVIVVIGVYRHAHKTPFKPKFVGLSDGSLQMEFYDFTKDSSSTRTKRFYAQYHVDLEVPYKNRHYKIVEIKEIADPRLLGGSDTKIVAYLEEI
ncbi:MAG: hypothetical protein LBS98_00420 [Coriobacteriales bacterium]|jgi:hypothetical protein|nr:hypothetical protein [Coriobacteriales bacterium]